MIRLEAFDIEHARKILVLYESIINNEPVSFFSPEELLRGIINGDAFGDGYRLGSQWDMHSKLRFEKENGFLRVGFYENFDPKDRTTKNRRYRQALKAKAEFEQQANALQ